MESLIQRIEILEKKVQKMESYFHHQTSGEKCNLTNNKHLIHQDSLSGAKKVISPISYTPADPKDFSYETESGELFSERFTGDRRLKSKCKELAAFAGKGLRITAYNGFDVESIVIPESIDGVPVISIGQRAFMNMEISSVVIPRTVKAILPKAFYNCKNLSNIDLPDGLEYIGEQCFRESGLKEIIIPDTVKVISKHCFSDCKPLTSVTFGKNVQKIESVAFSFCRLLNQIILPESLVELQDLCFLCTSVQVIIVPKNTKLVSNKIFGSSDYNNKVDIVFCGMDTEISGGPFYNVGTVYCLPGSAAQKYSREYRIPLKPLWEYSPDT
ncbi:MAG: leucine-rich repeat domain-containing protein [Ruminococcaceae bacterium]|nr:leucine-rich repeat domain-containing protein [Oscillospiraceae bacterium]